MSEPKGLTMAKLTEEMKPLFGQVCLLFRSDIGVLCGLGADHHDFYYIVRPQGRGPDKWYSAVGHCETLKGHLPQEMYDGIENIFELNGGLPEKFQTLYSLEDGTYEDYDEDKHRAMAEAWHKDHIAKVRARNEAEFEAGEQL
jgi:hypothetical protein